MRVNFLIDIVKTKGISGIQNAANRLAEKLRERNVDVVMNGKDYDYDIIHIHLPSPTFISYIDKIKEKTKAKIIIHAHTIAEDIAGSYTFSDAPTTNFLFKRYLKYFYNKADLVLTPGTWSKECLEKIGIKREIIPLSNGINLSKFVYSDEKRKEFRKEQDIGNNDKVVYCVGLVFLRKGVEDFKKVARDMPDTKFLWVGTMLNRLITKPIRLTYALRNIPDNMRFTGYVKDIVAAHCGGDIFFFPSKVETQGIVILEAGACKRPLLLRDIPAYRQWFKHDENCYMGKTAKDFENGIIKIFNDSEFSNRITDQAYKIAKKNDIEKSVDELVKIYEDLCD